MSAIPLRCRKFLLRRRKYTTIAGNLHMYHVYIYKDLISGVEGDLKVGFVCAENFKVIPQTISDETQVHISLTLCYLK